MYGCMEARGFRPPCSKWLPKISNYLRQMLPVTSIGPGVFRAGTFSWSYKIPGAGLR